MRSFACPLGVVLCFLLVAPAACLTRGEALDTAVSFANQQSVITSSNVYPTCPTTCYTSTCKHQLPIGTWTGEAYMWGAWDMPADYATRLTDDKGAGGTSCTSSGCRNELTGVDCSGLVGRSWGLTGDHRACGPTGNPNWSLLTVSREIKTPFSPLYDMLPADVLNNNTHIIEFVQYMSGGEAHFVEANVGLTLDGVAGSWGYSHFLYYEKIQDRLDAGYKAYKYVDFADKPTCTLVGFGADAVGNVSWLTSSEEGTAGFHVYRCDDGLNLYRISELIPAQGTAEVARYTFADPQPGHAGTAYRLEEVESSGRRAWVGRTARSQGLARLEAFAAGPQTEQTVAEHPMAKAAPRQTMVCPLSTDSSKRNVRWLAICKDGWEDELADLIGLREIQFGSAGVWTSADFAACGLTFDRETIKCELQTAYAEWTTKPEFVFLVGDWNYENPQAADAILPVWYRYEPEFAAPGHGGYIASDLPYADIDDDGVAELHVGRLPASNETEVANYVSKMTYMCLTGGILRRAATFIEDSGYSGNDSAWAYALGESLHLAVPQQIPRTRLIQSEIGGLYPAWEAAADSAWDVGQGFVNFTGNSSSWWDFNHFFDASEGWSISQLAPVDQWPFVVGASCALGAFDMTTWGGSVLEQLIVADPLRGCIGAYLPTGGVRPYPAVRFARHFYDAIMTHLTVGEAVSAAHASYISAEPNWADQAWEFILFGDPGMWLFGADYTSVPLAQQPQLESFEIAPNPATETFGLTFRLSTAADIHLDIFDASGRRVKRVIDGRAPEGTSRATWNGTDEAGHSVGTGVYFALLRSGRAQATRKMVYLGR